MINKLKLLTVVGTRPEIIRLSSVMKVCDKVFNHVVAHTGQNYDYELNEIFFDDLGLRKPDHFMNADVSSLGATVGDIFRKTEEILRLEKPDAMLVLGDTNSCLSAYMAKRLRVPVYHMEAGNRCFDLNVPEEINRKVIDNLADFNLVYTEHARRNLLNEGFPSRRIYLTGSPMNEVLRDNLEKITSSKILAELSLKPGNYFVVSVHREENIDNIDNLKQILSGLTELAEAQNLPVVVSTHPRTRKRLESIEGLMLPENILFMKPFGFSDYVHLQMNSKCTISDSGTISEESAILGFPAITIRNAMERPEAMDTGSIILSGLNSENVLRSVNFVMNNEHEITNRPKDYEIPNTSERVVKIILGTAGLSNSWNGISGGLNV
ncbi:MAG: UDP-N-acetylglucosamine 2-epimerase (non-hydrolyzing) [Ignavibacteriales bacterium]|nr:UDP-2,3-diacetamido-2,3-dideoxy-D-glucuronate 2-epimerase [Ignavibacteriaceae bacterium]MCZ2143773.1 UDP-N-acetylglucosamine 2-epimerase (non-hydrolyzing) [Ignavibacteriales bacterium]WKZ72804.1 MAG: UDP-N-acetylglucosamine 2-epimerase (non-hydrolyzing) [Ignavibacteriaceae bacterium]